MSAEGEKNGKQESPLTWKQITGVFRKMMKK